MEKHRVQVGASPNAAKGQGLFAKEKLIVGTVIPAKGPWFHTTTERRKWVGSVTAAATRDGEGKGLGEHSLVMRVTVEVKTGKELLPDLGTSHPVGRKRAPGPKGGKLRGIKRPRGAAKSAATGVAV